MLKFYFEVKYVFLCVRGIHSFSLEHYSFTFSVITSTSLLYCAADLKLLRLIVLNRAHLPLLVDSKHTGLLQQKLLHVIFFKFEVVLEGVTRCSFKLSDALIVVQLPVMVHN